jgi:undecaprenyl-diphosphatase
MVVTWIKAIVFRPRPTSDLVQVLNQLSDPSFPSGHVVIFTAYCGFLIYLAQNRLAASWARWVITVGLALVIALMGPSRIYLGDHWFSDVIGAYAFGSLWLALTMLLYLRRKK